MPYMITCLGCGNRLAHHARGLCVICYKRRWRHLNPDKRYRQRVRYRRMRAYKKHLARERRAAARAERRWRGVVPHSWSRADMAISIHGTAWPWPSSWGHRC